MSTTDTSTTQNRELSAFYYAGSCITLASSLFVIFSYIKFKACRQHPSSLIFWRSMSDIVFSLQFIILFSQEGSNHHCDIFSFLFQFSVLASQSWYFMNAVDLLRSMRNPFTDPAANMPMYHAYVWSMSIATSVAITASKHDDYRGDMQLCWTSVSGSVFNYVNWLTFFIPTLFYYFFSIGTVIYAGARLKKGLDQTFATRQVVLFNGIRYVAGFCAYWTFAGIIYGVIFLEGSSSSKDEGSVKKNNNLPLYATFAVTIAFRGVVDMMIWVYNQKVLSVYRLWWAGLPHDDPADVGLKDMDINRALRSEVLIFSTTGMALAIDKANAIPPSRMLPALEQYPVSLDAKEPRNLHSVVEITVSRADFTAGIMASAPAPAKVSSASSSSPPPATLAYAEGNNGVGEDNGDSAAAADSSADVEKVPFLDYAPQVFRYLRAQFGIEEKAYKASIQGKTESMIEKFTEGRGGAFFYFSEDGQYIVKTLTTSEGKFLTKFLPRYVEYMSRHRASLLSRFCGFHAITLYNLTIHFMVMQSVFLTTRKVHERYDLKGSFVDRHAQKGPSNSAKGKAGVTRRGAFRNVVFKDNDLNRTVRLAQKDREHFLQQVRNDAFFLRDCNIMDYSLLLGVHHTSHQVPLMSPVPRHEFDQPQQAAGNNASARGSSALLSLSPVGSLGAGQQGQGRDFASSESYAGPMGAAGRAAAAELLYQEMSKFRKDDGGVQASIIEGPGIYFFGLIDILQEYNTNKKMEHYAKVYLRCKNALGISAISPKPYADRFIRFMNDITRADDDELGAASPIAAPSSPMAAAPQPHRFHSSVAMDSQASTPATVASSAAVAPAPVHHHSSIAFQDRSEEKQAFVQPAPASPVRTSEVRLDVEQQQQQRLLSGADSAGSNAALSAHPSFLVPSSPSNAASVASAGAAAASSDDGGNNGVEETHPFSAAGGGAADEAEQFGSSVRPMNITDSEAGMAAEEDNNI